MVLALMLSLAGPAVALKADDPPPPVRVELNHENFTRGDRARVYVETAQDGHLIVLHADPDGRVRVLFPLDPSDDDFVRGGRQFELRGRSDRDAFFVDDGDGAGTVLAVFSTDPLSYGAFVRNDHWDYRALGSAELRDDPLAGLLDIARRMAGEARFEYDITTYVVGGEIASNYGSGYYGSGYGVGLSYGYRGYRGYRGYPWGWGDDPFCFDPFWGGCGWYGGFGYSSFYYGRPYYYGSYRPYVYSRFGGYGRSFAGGSRFVTPRDRVRVSGIQPRSRFGGSSVAPVARGSRDRVVSPRGGSSRGPRMTPRSGSSRGPSMSPRGGSGRGPSVSRPSGGGSRGRSQPSGGGSRSGGGGGGGGRRRP